MRMNWSSVPQVEHVLSSRINATSALRVAGLLGLLVVAGCNGNKEDCVYGCGNGSGDDGTTEPTTVPSDRDVTEGSAASAACVPNNPTMIHANLSTTPSNMII